MTYAELNTRFEDRLDYAAHGGLVVYGDRRSGAANAFHSTLSFGPLRYVFWTRLTWPERMALRIAHPQFDGWCKAQVRAAEKNPISGEVVVD